MFNVFHTFRTASIRRDVDFTKAFGSKISEDAKTLCEKATKSRKLLKRDLEGGDATGVVDAAQDYLIQIRSLIASMNSIKGKYQVNISKEELDFVWTSSLHSDAGKTFSHRTLIFDCIETVFQKGIALSNKGCELVRAEKLKESVVHFRRAAGIFEFIANDLIRTINFASDAVSPPELDAAACLALKEFMMAQAQQVSMIMAQKTGKGLKFLPTLMFGCVKRIQRGLTHLSTVKSFDAKCTGHFVALSALLKSTAHMKLGEACWSSDKNGEGLLHAQTAASLLEKALKDSRIVSGGELGRAMNKSLATFRSTATQWNEENETIYFDPPPEKLDDPKAKELFEATAFSIPDGKAVSFEPIEPVVTKKEDDAKVTDEDDDQQSNAVGETNDGASTKTGSKPRTSRGWMGAIFGGSDTASSGTKTKDAESTTTGTTAVDDDETDLLPAVTSTKDEDDGDDAMTSLPSGYGNVDRVGTKQGRGNDDMSLNWQFEENGGKWVHYIPADANVLDTAYRSGHRSAVITNRWGTYDVRLPDDSGYGSQKNRRSGAVRRVRCFGKKKLTYASDRPRDEATAANGSATTTVIHVRIPRGSHGGDKLRIMHGGRAFDVRIPEIAVQRGLETFPVSVPALPSPAASSGHGPRKSGLEMLVGMGFDKTSAERALRSADGNLERAAAMLASASLG